MAQEAGSKGRAPGPWAHRFVAPTKVDKHVCLRYMSMSPKGGFDVVSNEARQGGEETWQTKLKS
jgi:hypothetical protein